MTADAQTHLSTFWTSLTPEKYQLTLKALKESIEHWRRLTNGEREGLGPSNCALCVQFYKKICDGCPVSATTGESHCMDTPYYAAFDHFEPDSETQSPAFLTSAQLELSFLESLLPEK